MPSAIYSSVCRAKSSGNILTQSWQNLVPKQWRKEKDNASLITIFVNNRIKRKTGQKSHCCRKGMWKSYWSYSSESRSKSSRNKSTQRRFTLLTQQRRRRQISLHSLHSLQCQEENKHNKWLSTIMSCHGIFHKRLSDVGAQVFSVKYQLVNVLFKTVAFFKNHISCSRYRGGICQIGGPVRFALSLAQAKDPSALPK